MRAAGVTRLVFSSTCAIYGEPDEVPIAEDAPPQPDQRLRRLEARGRPDDRRRLRAPTGSARSACATSTSPARAGALGEDHEPETHLIPLVLRAAPGHADTSQIFGTDYPTPDGTAVRDYIHVEDLADAHLLALERHARGRARDLQPRHRQRLLGARGDRGRAAR